MRDERGAAVTTAIVCAAVLLIGVLVRHPAAGLVAALGFAWMRFSSYRERRKLRKGMLGFRQRLAEELEAGQAHSIVCCPSRIIEREEFEDEGALWIFDGGNGRYLAICGQEYYATPRFPSAHFEVVLGARHQSVIGIRSHGLRMPSTVVIKEEVGWDSFPKSDVTVFAAPPNAELPVLLRCLEDTRAV